MTSHAEQSDHLPERFGQTTTLIGIAPEIRARIYFHLFERVRLGFKGRWQSDPGAQAASTRRIWPTHPIPNILLTCRKVHDEAHNLLYSLATISFYEINLEYVRNGSQLCPSMNTAFSLSASSIIAIRRIQLQECHVSDFESLTKWLPQLQIITLMVDMRGLQGYRGTVNSRNFGSEPIYQWYERMCKNAFPVLDDEVTVDFVNELCNRVRCDGSLEVPFFIEAAQKCTSIQMDICMNLVGRPKYSDEEWFKYCNGDEFRIRLSKALNFEAVMNVKEGIWVLTSTIESLDVNPVYKMKDRGLSKWATTCLDHARELVLHANQGTLEDVAFWATPATPMTVKGCLLEVVQRWRIPRT